MLQQQAHIIILCSRLDLPGGVERAVVNTANLFDEQGYRVTLLILDGSHRSFYPLSQTITLVPAPLHFGITRQGNMLSRKASFLRHLRLLQKAFRQLHPDFIIGTEYQFSIAGFLAARNLPAKIFAWEHHHFHWLKRSLFWQLLMRIVYPKLDAVICLNPEEGRLYQSAGCRVAVVPNFVESKAGIAYGGNTLLTVGWLIKRKGIDLIPSIAKKIFGKYPQWTWKIVGTGDEEKWLREEIKRLRLENNIFILPPHSFDLSAAYSEAAIYVMPSRFECFPMVLLEAMSYSVPCVSFDCATGPSFIINNGKDGELVEQDNVTAMADAILNLIDNGEKRKAYGAAAQESVKRFSANKIFILWQHLFAIK